MSPTQQQAHPTDRVPGRASSRTAEADVVVVGARCAGSATAMLLARAGHDVLLVDRADFPSDTISTHLIVRPGVVQLHRWGLLDRVVASGAPAVRRVDFQMEGECVTRLVKKRYGVDHLVAPRRIVLDSILQEAAIGSGARIQTGVSIEDVLRDEHGRVAGVVGHDAGGPLEIRAAHVVGADGLSSRIARSVGASLTSERPAVGSAQYAYFGGSWPAIEYHLGRDGFAGVFPTHGGEACVWVCTPEQTLRRYRREHGSPQAAFSALMDAAAPELVGRLDPAGQTSPVRGMLRMPNHVRTSAGEGWALVGDAACHRDAITGHGISDALRDAELLAEALDEALRHPDRAAAALAAYERTRVRMAREVFTLTSELAAFPPLTRFVELQRRLAVAIDAMAGELAARPLPRVAELAA